MLGRSKSGKDIRSRIKHENTQLGSGTQMGGVPNNYGLHINASQMRAAQRQPFDGPSSASTSSPVTSPQLPSLPPSRPQQQQQQARDYRDSSHSSGDGTAAAHHAPQRGMSGSDAPLTHPAVAAAARELGAGPSFVSLSPSDSVSNYEGRLGKAPSSLGFSAGGQLEPTAGSTASFAQGQGQGLGGSAAAGNAATSAFPSAPQQQGTPSRPARSGRRPNRSSLNNGDVAQSSQDTTSQHYPSHSISTNAATAAPVGRNLLGSARAAAGASRGDDVRADPAPSRNAPSSSNDRHARSARLMVQVQQGDDGRATPGSTVSEEEDVYAGMEDDGYNVFNSNDSKQTTQSASSPPLGSLTRREQPAALSSVLSALSQAGRRQGQTRILRGVTAEEESRRRRIERKFEAARSRESKPLQAYVDPYDQRAFREICAVLRKVKAEWDFVVDDEFNSVSLALSMMDESSLGSSRHEFDEVKTLIEGALQGTVDDHYESFATAIGLHNNVLNSLTAAQGGVSGARRRLRDAREALGARRADLVQLWHRSQGVKDSLRLLDTIDHLKGVPDRLESLMAEKQFLEAVTLLTRALKVCAKPEVLEIGAAADLRGYLRGQEQAMFDILIEELHNHLYLKSFFCDARWKSYTPGQTTIPDVDFGQDYDELLSQQRQQQAQHDPENGSEKRAHGNSTGRDSMEGREGIEAEGTQRRRSSNDQAHKLSKYLKSLGARPVPDQSAENLLDLAPDAVRSHHGEPSGLPLSSSSDSIAGAAAAAAAAAGNRSQHPQHNPETDSFLYIEMLLESLARLGKLKVTQEVVLQRLPTELHQLVEATIDEVDTRSEMTRRGSTAFVRPESLLLSNSSALARSFAESAQAGFRNSLANDAGMRMSMGTSGSWAPSGLMRVSALETSQVERDAETMRDLFWTLFSKLDAVLQGHRVVFEVMTRISNRASSAAYKAVKVGKPASLTEIWRPIQAEVRALLHEHLVDESETSSTRRNAVISVNEVLRQGSFQRDRSKALFRLMTDLGTRSGANLSRRDFAPLRRHEEALTTALRASVPGLIGAASETASGGGSSVSVFHQHSQQPKSKASAPSGMLGGGSDGFADAGGHKLLVKPDAFNISVLFQPALAFIERVKMLLPPEAAGRVAEGDDVALNGSGGASTGFSRFLDEFVRDVFLSQLEDKVQTLFATAAGGPDAFQEDAMFKARSTDKPIVRSVANILVLIDSLYAMLRTTPFHRESYSLLIIQTIVQYYQRCHDRYRDLTTQEVAPVPPRATTRPSVDTGAAAPQPSAISSTVLSAMWAQRPEISACLSEVIRDDITPERLAELQDLENALELKLTSTLRTSTPSSVFPPPPSAARGRNASVLTESVGTIALPDLTTSRKRLLALGNLHNSLLWLHDHIIRLKATTGDVSIASRAVARLSVNQERLAASGQTLSGEDGDDNDMDEGVLRLPLSASMATRFQTLPGTYQHLANMVLFTLRLEVRARVIRHLDLAINEGNYLVEDAVIEPDPHIVDLNSELASLDDIFSDTLRPQYHAFIFRGLASLMDVQLCRAIRKIRFINRNGLTKMIRNILALQQNLRNIVVVHEAMQSVDAAGDGAASQGSAAGKKTAARNSGYAEAGGNFERCRRLWELVGKDPEHLLNTIRTSGAQHSFDDYQSALNLMMGIDNGAGPASAATGPGSNANTGAQSDQGPQLPGANLRPGTSDQPRERSRQNINEYLIELHEVAGEAL